MDRKEFINLLVKNNLDTKTALDLIGVDSMIFNLQDRGYIIYSVKTDLKEDEVCKFYGNNDRCTWGEINCSFKGNAKKCPFGEAI
jgi:hypothetical protein